MIASGRERSVELTARQRTRKSRPFGDKSAKYQWFGTRREGWLPWQASEAAEMKQIYRPKDLPDVPAECVISACNSTTILAQEMPAQRKKSDKPEGLDLCVRCLDYNCDLVPFSDPHYLSPHDTDL